MRVRDYLKDKMVIILVNGTGIYVLSLFLIMLQNQISAVILIDIAWLIVLFCTMAIDFYQKKKYFERVEGILEKLDKAYLISEVMPQGKHIEDRIYHNVLRRSNKSVIEAIHEKENQQEDYRSFIESWVHEVKTPITSVMLMCENMENANEDYLIHPYDLRKIVSTAIQRNRIYLRQNQAQIEVDIEQSIVSTDEKWVEFILTQFITNSVKYKSDRPLYIHFWCEEKDSKVVLYMEDRGIGIPKEEIGRIFDKGYTGNNGRTTHYSTGMGLYLCKKLCDKLGIGISCESEEGSYTRMILTFPNSSFYEGAKAYKNESFK